MKERGIEPRVFDTNCYCSRSLAVVLAAVTVISPVSLFFSQTPNPKSRSASSSTSRP